MKSTRAAGIILHPTSLPGPDGIGDLGPEAYEWVRFLKHSGANLWQVLPLGPTGYGDSPYQCFSALAGNPLLISLERLADDGLLEPDDLQLANRPQGPIDYAAVDLAKQQATAAAWKRFKAGAAPAMLEPFECFCHKNADWLPSFATFMVLKSRHGGAAWHQWDGAYRQRRPSAMRGIDREARDEVQLNEFRQFLFFQQWQSLRAYAAQRGVQFIGDMPIFVANDSADVWSHPELFQLDERLEPTVVAGVPPDYFSADGQRWGNPLYAWSEHEKTNFAWWIERLRASFDWFDLVRLDHFRGFEGYWAIPAACPTARDGEWVPAPGRTLLERARAALGRLPLIAEDLGEITPPVHALREEFELPGMRVLQFAFGGAQEDRFLPHHFDRNTVAYTGTHDNETTLGWYAQLTATERAFFHRYAGGGEDDPVDALIRQGWASVADWAIAPMQDVLRLDNNARMNHPGRPTGNWRWRMTPDALAPQHFVPLGELTELYQRSPRGFAAAMPAAMREADDAA